MLSVIRFALMVIASILLWVHGKDVSLKKKSLRKGGRGNVFGLAEQNNQRNESRWSAMMRVIISLSSISSLSFFLVCFLSLFSFFFFFCSELSYGFQFFILI